MEILSGEFSRATRFRLLVRAAELRERLNRVRSDLRRDTNPLPRDSADAAIAVENDEVLKNIESVVLEELRHIEHALERLEAGTFAVCERCGGQIAQERLTVVPFATRCQQCAGLS